MNELKLNQLKFGLAGGLITGVFVLFVELLLWIKLIPLYNSIMINVYGVPGFTSGFLLMISILLIVLGFILGFILALLFALIYNKLLSIKVK